MRHINCCVRVNTVQYGYLLSWGSNFRGFHWSLIHDNLYTWCLRYNICSTWFIDIKISTCLNLKEKTRSCVHL